MRYTIHSACVAVDIDTTACPYSLLGEGKDILRVITLHDSLPAECLLISPCSRFPDALKNLEISVVFRREEMYLYTSLMV